MAEPIEMPFGVAESGGPKELRYVLGGTHIPKEKGAILGKSGGPL